MALRFAALLASLTFTLLTAPPPAEAQQPRKVYRIGFLQSVSSVYRPGGPTGALQIHLSDLGYVWRQAEGAGNLVMDFRTAVESDEELPRLSAELVGLNVDVIMTLGTRATHAAKRATRTIPIIMLIQGDPVRAGLVASLGRPGGNVTGFTMLVPELSAKRLELLREMVPGLVRVGVLRNPADSEQIDEWSALQVAARAAGVELQSLEVRTPDDFEPTLRRAVEQRVNGLVVLAGHLTNTHGALIAELAAKSRLPTIYPHRFFTEPLYGGLASYAAGDTDLSRRVAAYVDKIFKGANPGELPVEQPRRFELVVNMKTARALGLTIPASVLVRADKIIE